MASEFAYVQFWSLDFIPIMPHTQRENIVFEVYDFAKGILLEDGSQDAVFLNFVMERVTNYPELLREVNCVLCPGGLLRICDYSPYPWDPEDPSIHALRTTPLSCHYSYQVREVIKMAGVDMDAFDNLHRWLAPESTIWKEETGIGPRFEQIHTLVRVYPM
ncbi:methyltransferase domain protein [Ceratobasidium sp. AG-Ba]|nr:methyltransferase domain protein [Ceratobasidium sp. AG-Ba]